jgi:putative oxidoreductase
MADLQLHSDETPSIVMRAFAAAFPVALGLLFIYIGATKFRSSGMWVGLFQRIGFGDWFRYFTGGMQILGGLLVLAPRTRIVGAAMIACTMLGAAIADVFVLNFGPAAILPLALFAAATAAGWQAWANKD